MGKEKSAPFLCSSVRQLSSVLDHRFMTVSEILTILTTSFFFALIVEGRTTPFICQPYLTIFQFSHIYLYSTLKVTKNWQPNRKHFNKKVDYLSFFLILLFSVASFVLICLFLSSSVCSSCFFILLLFVFLLPFCFLSFLSFSTFTIIFHSHIISR